MKQGSIFVIMIALFFLTTYFSLGTLVTSLLLSLKVGLVFFGFMELKKMRFVFKIFVSIFIVLAMIAVST